jgi:hypothetical protein
VTIRFADDDGQEDHTSRLTVYCRNGRPVSTSGEDDRSPEHR